MSSKESSVHPISGERGEILKVDEEGWAEVKWKSGQVTLMKYEDVVVDSDRPPSLETHPNDPFELVQNSEDADPIYRRRQELSAELDKQPKCPRCGCFRVVQHFEDEELPDRVTRIKCEDCLYDGPTLYQEAIYTIRFSGPNNSASWARFAFHSWLWRMYGNFERNELKEMDCEILDGNPEGELGDRDGSWFEIC